MKEDEFILLGHNLNINFTGNGSNFSVPLNQKPSQLFTFICGVFVAFFMIIGVLGNLWIVIVILRAKTMRVNVINLFIASLCINDLFNLACNNGMVSISYLTYDWIVGHTLCDLMPELNMVLVCVSLWHHALIALHRYIVVVRNSSFILRHRGLYCGLIIAGTRIFAVLLSLSHPLFNNGEWLHTTKYFVKMLRCIYNENQKLRILIIVLLTQILPCIIVLVCFALVFMFVHKTGTRSTIADRVLFRREIQITKMFGIVFLMFLIGFIPYGFVRMADSNNKMSADVYVVVTLGYAFASCFNPIIFGAMNPDIRQACLSLIGLGSSSNIGQRSHQNSKTFKTSLKESFKLKDVDSNTQETKTLITKNGTQMHSESNNTNHSVTNKDTGETDL